MYLRYNRGKDSKEARGIGYQSGRQEMTGLEAWGMVLIFFIFFIFLD